MHAFRDSVTGGYVTEEYAQANPSTTQRVTLEEPKANLGMATTFELIKELSTRAQLSQINGESWPNYTTVKGH